jgi:hypothetical protein
LRHFFTFYISRFKRLLAKLALKPWRAHSSSALMPNWTTWTGKKRGKFWVRLMQSEHSGQVKKNPMMTKNRQLTPISTEGNQSIFLLPVKLTSTGRPAKAFATMGSFDSAGRDQLPEGGGCGRVCQNALVLLLISAQ